jgi:hypothetical protein
MDAKENVVVESNVALAMVIGEHSPLINKEVAPKTPPRKTSLRDWAASATPSPDSSPLSDLPKLSNKSITKVMITSNDLFKSLGENESRSVFGDNSNEQNSSTDGCLNPFGLPVSSGSTCGQAPQLSTVLDQNSSRDTYQKKLSQAQHNHKFKNAVSKMKYPKKKFIKTERKNLNNWIIYFGLSGSDSIFGSESKGNLIRKMQKEKIIGNNIPKEVDITDGRSKNIYTPEEFVSILNYIIQHNKIRDLDFDYAKKKDTIEIEENHLYFDNSEEILNQKLMDLNLEGRLNI